MGKSLKLIIAALGLSGLGYFLYKKGLLFSSPSKVTPVTPVTPVKPILPTVKTPPVCESGFKLQMVDINCNGQDCEVHCVPIPAVPEEKLIKIEKPVFVPAPIFKEVPINPVIFQPYTSIPVAIIVDPTVGVVQNPTLPVTDNTFKTPEVVVINDPFEEGQNNSWVVNKKLNQILYR